MKTLLPKDAGVLPRALSSVLNHDRLFHSLEHRRIFLQVTQTFKDVFHHRHIVIVVTERDLYV